MLAARLIAARLAGLRWRLPFDRINNNNTNTFTWSGPSGVLGCTGQRPVGRDTAGADKYRPASDG
jgi:hypothetical protein